MNSLDLNVVNFTSVPVDNFYSIFFSFKIYQNEVKRFSLAIIDILNILIYRQLTLQRP